MSTDSIRVVARRKVAPQLHRLVVPEATKPLNIRSQSQASLSTVSEYNTRKKVSDRNRKLEQLKIQRENEKIAQKILEM